MLRRVSCSRRAERAKQQTRTDLDRLELSLSHSPRAPQQLSRPSSASSSLPPFQSPPNSSTRSASTATAPRPRSLASPRPRPSAVQPPTVPARCSPSPRSLSSRSPAAQQPRGLTGRPRSTLRPRQSGRRVRLLFLSRSRLGCRQGRAVLTSTCLVQSATATPSSARGATEASALSARMTLVSRLEDP